MSLGMYELYVCSDGSYNIVSYVPIPGAWQPETLLSGNSAAIHQGSSENTIAAVADGSNFALYVNDQKIANFTNSLFGAGTIGFLAEDGNETTTVDYQDAIIWVLP